MRLSARLRPFAVGVTGAVVGALSFAGPSSAEPACASSSPSTGAYTVTVCVTEPGAGSTLTGEVAVAATVSVSGSSTSISRVIFGMDAEYVLSDFQAPFSFTLPSPRWADGIRNLSAKVAMSDGFTSAPATVPVSLVNGVSTPPSNPGTFSPRGTIAPEGERLVVGVDGDGASGKARIADVARLVAGWDPDMFIYLGDVYENGSIAEFHNHYGGQGGPYFGRFSDITNPTVGNHEYSSPGAAPYFHFWDNVPHHYSYDAGGWHFISLDSTSNFGQTSTTSAQYQWLSQDLASDPNPCKIAYWHHPLFSTALRGGTPRMAAIWNLLDSHGVDLVLTGHDHNYQRWVPLDSSGTPSSTGITQIVAGTGGHSVYRFGTSDSRVAAGIDTAPNAYGAVRLELNPEGLGYSYQSSAGLTLDSGSIACGETPDVARPSAPTGLTATAASSERIDLAWSGSTDNVGVVGYDIYRDGVLIRSVGAQTTAVDTGVTPGASYEYVVRARDAAGNSSDPSDAAAVTVPATLFADGFETGNLSRWTYSSGFSVQGSDVRSGAFAGRAASSGAASHVRKDTTTPHNEFFWRFGFKIAGKSAHTVYLTRLRTSTNAVVGGLFLNPWNRLAWRNNPANKTLVAPSPVSKGVWHSVEVHAVINGTYSITEVWLDGTKIDGLSNSDTLGTTGIKGFQIGESQAMTGRSFDILFDDAVLSKQATGP